MNGSTKITAAEVATVLRRVLAGTLTLQVDKDGFSWGATYCGNVAFRAGPWRIVFYNDCDELDYVDEVDTDDGRHGEFGEWGEGRLPWCPLELLTSDECVALELLLEGVL